MKLTFSLFSASPSCLLFSLAFLPRFLHPFFPFLFPRPPSVGPHIGRYCGHNSPGQVISYTGILSMTITTDSAIAKEGFSANYTIRERSLPPGHEDEGEQLDEWGGCVMWGWRCHLVLKREKCVSVPSHGIIKTLAVAPHFSEMIKLECRSCPWGRCRISPAWWEESSVWSLTSDLCAGGWVSRKSAFVARNKENRVIFWIFSGFHCNSLCTFLVVHATNAAFNYCFNHTVFLCFF